MRARLWIAVIGFILLAGCGSDAGSTQGNTNGPGVVMTQTVDVTKGASITVQAPGNPLNGTVVNIPANTLGLSGTDTISIGYSDSPPGQLDPSAVAAGGQIVSKAVQLTHTSTTELANSITITVPYDTATVGPDDVPTVLYWNEVLGQYEAIKTISFSRAAGTITFRTHHFSTYLVAYVSGLFKALSGKIPFSAALSGGVDTKFRPNVDGFAVSNFSTQYGAAHGGACYGLTAFAKWNYVHHKPSLFSNYFGSTNPLIQNPLEQDLARELIYATYVTTYLQNDNTTGDEQVLGSLTPLSDIDSLTAQQLISNMALTHEPQMLDLYANRDYINLGSAHSVLVYAWSSSGGFSIYDPNSYADIDPMSPPIPETISFQWPNFSPYSVNLQYLHTETYRLFLVDSQDAYYSDNDMEKLYAAAPSGSTNNFKNAVSPLTLTNLVPSGVPVIHGAVAPNSKLNFNNLYVYSWVDDKPNAAQQVSPDGSFDIPIDSFIVGKNSEFLVIVSGLWPFTTANQWAIENGYVGVSRTSNR